jgi:hypothetical protein
MQTFFSMTAHKNPRNGKIYLRGKLGQLHIIAYMRSDKEWDFYIEEPKEGK